MKKFLSILVLISFLAVLVVPAVALAQVDSCTVSAAMGARINAYFSQCPAAGGTYSETTATKSWGLCCAFNGILTITDWVFAILMVLVVLLVVWGAYDILTAAGGPEKIKAGRDRIVYAMVGLAVAILAKAIPSLVKAILGV